ncbi:MAG: hypothetical protein IKJ34_07110 [Mailhella sp.]|nr:hypothetical protein [Mailhella sp.]
MPSASNSRLQTVFSLLLSLVIATGLWYLVVGRDHVETQVELRVEYRGLPSGLVIDEGLTNNLSVRLRGSAELLRNLHSRDLVYTVDLSSVQRGANALPLRVADLPDLKPFEIMEVIPSRLVLEADAVTERVIPLASKILPLSKDSPYLMSDVILEPSFVTVRGPEARVNALESLSVTYDPNKNTSEGSHEANVAIAAPTQVEITPPVTTLRYSLEIKSESVILNRVIQLEDESGEYSISPTKALIEISVPESLAHDNDYLDAVRIVVRPPADMELDSSADVPPMVMLPSGARLDTVSPAAVVMTRKTATPKEVWAPALSPFTMPVNVYGMGLPEQRITKDFSLDDIEIPAAAIPQPDDLKVQPVIPSDAGQEKADAVRAGLSAGEAERPAPIAPQMRLETPQITSEKLQD